MAASMGPHSFKCGSVNSIYSRWSPHICFNGAALFQVRKSENWAPTVSATVGLQWGRTLSSAEVSNSNFLLISSILASMGPHSFKCGSDRGGLKGQENLPRFNGAALFQVRKSVDDRIVVDFAAPASMGPHSFKCGSSPRNRAGHDGSLRFNGAALFQVRK